MTNQVIGKFNPKLARLRNNWFGMLPDAHSMADDVVAALTSKKRTSLFLFGPTLKVPIIPLFRVAVATSTSKRMVILKHWVMTQRQHRVQS